MRELSVRQMRAGYGAIAEALADEGEVILTHHGKPFAKVVPLDAASAGDAASAVTRQAQLQAWGRERRRALAKMKELPPFDWEEFRKDRV